MGMLNTFFVLAWRSGVKPAQSAMSTDGARNLAPPPGPYNLHGRLAVERRQTGALTASPIVLFPVRFAYSLVVQSVRLRRELTICFRLGSSCGKALQTKGPLNLCPTAITGILPDKSLSRPMIANLTMFRVQNLGSAAGREMPRFVQPWYLSLFLFKIFLTKSYHLDLVLIQVLPALEPVSVRSILP